MDKGDYATALKEWRPLAEQGDAEAQYALGVIYNHARGVPQDYEKAFHWYSKAAAQGLAMAQSKLGMMYGLGRGVPQDYVLAHLWMSLAAAQGIEQARKIRDKLAEKMTPAQLADAQRLALEWKPKSK